MTSVNALPQAPPRERRGVASTWRLDVALSLLIGALVWLTRAWAGTAFVSWDEPAWVFRSVKFLQALGRGD